MENESGFKKILDKVDEINTESDFENKKRAFLTSQEAVNEAQNEVQRMYAGIENRIKEIQNRTFNFGIEKDTDNQSFILQNLKFSLSILWKKEYIDSNEGAILYVRQWRGFRTKREDIYLRDGEAKILKCTEYVFDRNREGENCWLSKAGGKQYLSKQIIDYYILWLVEQIGK